MSKNKEIKNNYLQRLQTDINIDRTTLKELQASYKFRKMHADTVLNHMTRHMKIEDVRPIQRSMIHMFLNTPFVANDNTFKDLINSGRMDIFSDGELKFELLELYTFYKKIKAQEAHIELDNREYIFNPSAASVDYVTYYDLPVEERYQILQEQFNDHRIPNGLMIYRNNHPEFDKRFTEALGKIISIDSIITLQLKE